MRIRLLVVAALLPLLCMGQTTSPTTGTPSQVASDPTAVAKLASAYAAFAGTQNPADARIVGTVIRHVGNDSSGTFTYELTGEGRAKLQLNLDEGTIVEWASGYSDPIGCSWSFNGTPHKTALHNCSSPASWLLPLLALKPTQQKLRVSFAKSDLKLDVPSSDKLEEKLSSSQLSVDPVTFLPKRLRFRTHPDRDALTDLPVQIEYSDYRDVSGVKVPFSVKKSLNGSTILEFTVTSVEFNTGTEAK
jgi:hypothetical protein